MRAAVGTALCLALAGCSAISDRPGAIAMGQQIDAACAAGYRSFEHSGAINGQIGSDLKMTAAQMDSKNTPSVADRPEIQRYIAAAQYCFNLRNDWYSVHVPSLKPIAVRGQAADLVVLADLADGKITYGEANVRMAAIYSDTEAAYERASK